MLQTNNKNNESWQFSSSPSVLTDLFLPEKHIIVWERRPEQAIQSYFDSVFEDLGQGLRSVYVLDALKKNLAEDLPEGEGKAQAIEDIYLLADMLTCLFDSKNVGLRLAPLTKAMCPRFHVDNIPARMVCTYLGNGTQWIPAEALDHSKLGHASNGKSDDQSGLYADPEAVQQLNAFDVAILKGSTWDNDVAKAVVHRSCPVEVGQKRVLLSLDPM